MPDEQIIQDLLNLIDVGLITADEIKSEDIKAEVKKRLNVE